MLLTAEKVEELVRYCLFTEEELAAIPKGNVPSDANIARGVRTHMGFNPRRIKEKKEEIRALLMELPHQFRESVGGGWSFLNACNDKDGNQWGEHRDIDALMCLGLGVGLVRLQLPRDVWGLLPGGLPYFVVIDRCAAPRYKHDCDSCVWLGTFHADGKERDFYHCPAAPEGSGSTIGDGGTPLARFDNEPSHK